MMFYRLRRISLSTPLDTDGDGIDDVWELQKAPRLSAFNGFDAQLPSESIGSPTWKQIYDMEKSDSQLPLVSFATSESLVLRGDTARIPVNLPRPFSGILWYQISGGIPNFDVTSLEGSTPVSSSSTLLEIPTLPGKIIESAQSLTVSLFEPPNATYRTSPSLTESAPGRTHTLRLVDGEAGAYLGIMTFTNTTFIGSQKFRFAVRHGSVGRGTAHFVSDASSLFKEAFDVPVSIGVGDRFVFDSIPVQGDLRGSLVAGRTVRWNLTMTQSSPLDQGQNMPGLGSVVLELNGLVASEAPVRLQGQLVYTLLD